MCTLCIWVFLDRIPITPQKASGSNLSKIGSGFLPQLLVDNQCSDVSEVIARTILSQMICIFRGFQAISLLFKLLGSTALMSRSGPTLKISRHPSSRWSRSLPSACEMSGNRRLVGGSELNFTSTAGVLTVKYSLFWLPTCKRHVRIFSWEKMLHQDWSVSDLKTALTQNDCGLKDKTQNCCGVPSRA